MNHLLKQPVDMSIIKVRIVLTTALILLCILGYGADSTIVLRRNVAFASFGGKENFGSINYERIFSAGRKLNWSYSVGVQPFQPSKKFAVPVSVNVFTAGRAHHLELDLNATFYMDKMHPLDGGLQEDFNKQLYLTPFICYRWQRRHWLVLKTGIGQQWLIDPPEDDILKARTTRLSASVFVAAGIAF